MQSFFLPSSRDEVFHVFVMTTGDIPPCTIWRGHPHLTYGVHHLYICSYLFAAFTKTVSYFPCWLPIAMLAHTSVALKLLPSFFSR